MDQPEKQPPPRGRRFVSFEGDSVFADELLSVDDVAAHLGMTPDRVYREAGAGRLPHVRLGRDVRFRRESIDAWVKANPPT